MTGPVVWQDGAIGRTGAQSRPRQPGRDETRFILATTVPMGVGVDQWTTVLEA